MAYYIGIGFNCFISSFSFGWILIKKREMKSNKRMVSIPYQISSSMDSWGFKKKMNNFFLYISLLLIGKRKVCEKKKKKNIIRNAELPLYFELSFPFFPNYIVLNKKPLFSLFKTKNSISPIINAHYFWPFYYEEHSFSFFVQ